MASPSLTLNVDVNQFVNGLWKSCKQAIAGIDKLKNEFGKLIAERNEDEEAEPDERVATIKVNQWLHDLESLEGQLFIITSRLGHGVATENTTLTLAHLPPKSQGSYFTQDSSSTVWRSFMLLNGMKPKHAEWAALVVDSTRYDEMANIR
ncbi:hypothetical protein ZIOFF_062517 [Zingiber officinale]|uniref:Uncharacterized protein n=1 Tax=Zingiber officinale TaxID=94328 RepID=A0A8J5F0G2_ZINOF|nr:hypothetical protein ZIOFF_062517 [Zingiber officinale]